MSDQDDDIVEVEDVSKVHSFDFVSRKNNLITFQMYDESVEAFKQFVIPENVVEVEGDKVIIFDEDFQSAKSVGIEWELVLSDVHIPATDIAKALYGRGIRTVRDYVENPQSLRGIVAESAQEIPKMLGKIVKQYKKEVSSNE